jgi:hypothetical protein
MDYFIYWLMASFLTSGWTGWYCFNHHFGWDENAQGATVLGVCLGIGSGAWVLAGFGLSESMAGGPTCTCATVCRELARFWVLSLVSSLFTWICWMAFMAINHEIRCWCWAGMLVGAAGIFSCLAWLAFPTEKRNA